MFESPETIMAALAEHRYVADRALATTVYLAHKLGKPILLEGEAGVGKTELAKVLAAANDTKLIRLQCYEGLDANHALYEWNYPKQMLRIKLEEGKNGNAKADLDQQIFSEEYLIRRPLLEAITADTPRPPILLIDEVDRADEEFEAFLLEILSDFQVTIPEIGTMKARHQPFVVLTSNRTRELHDALKRRCLYLWISYPSLEREYEIVLAKVPEVNRHLAEQIVRFMQVLRTKDFYKRPGVAETLDWANALVHLHRDELDPETIEETAGTILKYQEDVARLNREAESILKDLQATGGDRLQCV